MTIHKLNGPVEQYLERVMNEEEKKENALFKEGDKVKSKTDGASGKILSVDPTDKLQPYEVEWEDGTSTSEHASELIKNSDSTTVDIKTKENSDLDTHDKKNAVGLKKGDIVKFGQDYKMDIEDAYDDDPAELKKLMKYYGKTGTIVFASGSRVSIKVSGLPELGPVPDDMLDLVKSSPTSNSDLDTEEKKNASDSYIVSAINETAMFLTPETADELVDLVMDHYVDTGDNDIPSESKVKSMVKEHWDRLKKKYGLGPQKNDDPSELDDPAALDSNPKNKKNDEKKENYDEPGYEPGVKLKGNGTTYVVVKWASHGNSVKLKDLSTGKEEFHPTDGSFWSLKKVK